MRRRAKVNPEAYDDFLRGVIVARKGEQGFREAISHFENAAKKEPNFARPYAAMALTYYQFSFAGTYAPKEFMPEVESAARKALELDETLADAHFALGAVLYRYHWDWRAAEREFRRALELPSSFSRVGYQEFLVFRGRAEEAVAQLQREREQDPLSPVVIENTDEALMAEGRYDEAAATYKRLLEKQFDQPRFHYHSNPRFVAYLG